MISWWLAGKCGLLEVVQQLDVGWQHLVRQSVLGRLGGIIPVRRNGLCQGLKLWVVSCTHVSV